VNKKDPYLHEVASDSDEEEYHEVNSEDLVFLSTSCEDESCTLEMSVYSEEEGTVYIHHEVNLFAYPLCVEWLDGVKDGSNSFAAVGSIDHSINIWDMNVLETVHPVLSLMEAKPTTGKTKGKRRRRRTLHNTAHDDAVLGLHSSPFNNNVLVSASADETVKVWEISESKCVHSYHHHSEKVQCAQWHPTEQAILLTAAFDERIAFLDVRDPSRTAMLPLPGEVEAAIWNRHRPFECFVSTDKGNVVCFDVRRVANPSPDAPPLLWTLAGHQDACTTVQDSVVPNMIITASLDGTTKIWDVSSGGPKLVHNRKLKAGKIFTCHTCSDAPALACYGAHEPVIFDMLSEKSIVDHFNLPRD